ncbi:hypothetical protein BC835DRAFT_1379442 [Cytidiella melzeri]|nr:hypothetical protein BC835DRAFT_1379442 [Cytidiella melzeri]
MSSVSDEKRYTFSRRVRDLLLSKPKESPNPPSISHPSRLPVRQKRSYREVDTNDSDVCDLHNRSPSSVATSRGARVRQRTDSTSSVATIRPVSKSLDLGRTTSRDSEQSVLDSSQKKHVRTSSAVNLNPGPAGLARTALSRSTSHNQVHVKDDVPKHAGVAFPSISTSSAPLLKAKLVTKQKTSVPLSRKSSSMMSICSTDDKDPAPSRMPASSSTSARQLSRTSSMMSIVSSDSGPCRPFVSRIPVSSFSKSPSRSSSPDDIPSALDRALAQELEDADAGTDFRNMVASITRATSAKHRARRAPDYARSFVSACLADKSLLKGWKRGRFDVQVDPEMKHIAVWDANNTDIMAWCGSLVVADTSSPSDLTAAQYDYPPIELLELEFSSVSYLGGYYKTDAFTPASGIAIEHSWRWGYAPTPGSRDTLTPYSDRPTYLLPFYVPIPLSLFERCEYRRFRIKCRIVFGAREAGLSPLVAHSGVVDVAVEHLRKETHMDGRKPLFQTATPPPSTLSSP